MTARAAVDTASVIPRASLDMVMERTASDRDAPSASELLAAVAQTYDDQE